MADMTRDVALGAPVVWAHTQAPAGGASASEVAVAVLVAVVLATVVARLVAVRRRGPFPRLERAAAAVGRIMRTPGWAALPLAVAGTSLVVAVTGFYWDVATHIDHGRDEGVFGNAAHWPILVGLVGIAAAGLLAVLLKSDERAAGAVRLPGGCRVPVGGVLLLVCGLTALAGFPIDDLWHRLFGQDVTLWSPPHIQMVAGASLCTLALWVLSIEAQRAKPRPTTGRRRRWREVATAGAVLIGLSTLQGEFDFGVPQFNQLFHPLLVAIAAGIALVPARARLGPGGALQATGFFLAVRALLSLAVTGMFGHLTFHFPLYLGAALAVEAVARIAGTRRQLTFGAWSGLAIGTAGLAVEAAWTQLWMPMPWGQDLLPEVLYIVPPAAVAAGVTGGFLARALAPPDRPRQAVPALLAPAAAAVLVSALAFPLPTTGVDAVAHLALEPVDADGRRMHVTARLEPQDAAHGARWFEVLAWQGAAWDGDGHAEAVPLASQGGGVYRTTRPVPVTGEWKSMIRLHRGRALVAAPIFLPEDRAIPAEEVPALAAVTRRFVPDRQVLLREARPVPAWVHPLAHLLMLAIAGAWIGAFVWGIRRTRLAAAGLRDRVDMPT